MAAERTGQIHLEGVGVSCWREEVADLSSVLLDALAGGRLEDGEEDQVEGEEKEDGRHFPAAAEAVRTGEESLRMDNITALIILFFCLLHFTTGYVFISEAVFHANLLDNSCLKSHK